MDVLSFTAAELAWLLEAAGPADTGTLEKLGLTEAAEPVRNAGFSSLHLRGVVSSDGETATVAPHAAAVAQGITGAVTTVQAGFAGGGEADGGIMFSSPELRIFVAPRAFDCYDALAFDPEEPLGETLAELAQQFLLDREPSLATFIIETDGQDAQLALAAGDGDDWTFVTGEDATEHLDEVAALDRFVEAVTAVVGPGEDPAPPADEHPPEPPPATRSAMTRSRVAPDADLVPTILRSEVTEMGHYRRTFVLDDIQILSRAKGGDGRTVTAYCAVFDEAYEVRDQYGHYEEEIARAAFNRTLNGAGARAACCLYNHGMTLDGKANIIAQVPLGSPLKIEPDARGLLTVTRYNDSALAEATLASIRNGDIKAQSFQGPVYRSTPDYPRGIVPRQRAGQPLPRITRMELGLRDYGPTPNPVNDTDMIVAVRSAVDMATEIAGLDEAGRADLIRAIASTTPLLDPETPSATPASGPGGAEDPPTDSGHSGRLMVARARLRMELIQRGIHIRGQA